jgi:signal transduction histidine kinase
MDLAKRSEPDEIDREKDIVARAENVDAFINVLPNVTLILNENRQVVFANNRLAKALGMSNLNDAIGARLGEILHCIHAFDELGGCGTAEACKYCGAVLTIIRSLETDREEIGECRLTVDAGNGRHVSMDVRVNAAPLRVQGRRFLVVSIADISAEKYKERMERFFFHDVANTAGAVMGMTALLKEQARADEKETFELLSQASRYILEEIHAHRDLMRAEHHDLKASISKFAVGMVVGEALSVARYFTGPNGTRFLEADVLCPAVLIETDQVLLRRTLVNMLKNAIEASRSNEKILIKADLDTDAVVFSVHNQAVMSPEVKIQVFQRSFSTKGSTRGQGTYSIRLLTEDLLKGRAWFLSDEGKGTTFFVRIPRAYPR